MDQVQPKTLILNNWSIAHGKIYHLVPGTTLYINKEGTVIKDYKHEKVIIIQDGDDYESISVDEQNKWRLVHGLIPI